MLSFTRISGSFGQSPSLATRPESQAPLGRKSLAGPMGNDDESPAYRRHFGGDERRGLGTRPGAEVRRKYRAWSVPGSVSSGRGGRAARAARSSFAPGHGCQRRISVVVQALPSKGAIRALAFSPTGGMLATGENCSDHLGVRGGSKRSGGLRRGGTGALPSIFPDGATLAAATKTRLLSSGTWPQEPGDRRFSRRLGTR